MNKVKKILAHDQKLGHLFGHGKMNTWQLHLFIIKHDVQERYQLAKDEYDSMTLTWSTNTVIERKQIPQERYFQLAAKQRDLKET